MPSKSEYLKFLRKKLKKRKNKIVAGKRAVLSDKQQKAKPNSRQAAKDSSPEQSKKVQPDVNNPAKMAAAGETVPIVFCKRANQLGGAWMKPSILKTAVEGGRDHVLVAVSQGEIGENPRNRFVFIGRSTLLARSLLTPQITRHYKTPAALASNKLDCPLTGGVFHCDRNISSFVQALGTEGTFINREPPQIEDNYYRVKIVTVGSGDLTNTVFKTTYGAGFNVFDNDSGTDITTQYRNANPSILDSTEFTVNKNTSTGGGFAAGTVQNVNSGNFFPPYTGATDIVGFTGTRTFRNQGLKLDNQFDTGSSATDTTLEFQRWEYKLSPYADPSSPPATDPVTSLPMDFTAFADITFVEISGNLFSFSVNSDGNGETKLSVVSFYWRKGVKVALYSAGTPGTEAESNQFVDLVMFLFKLIGRADPSSSTALTQAVDTSNLQTIATFASTYSLFFNGVIDQQYNVLDFVSKIAPFFLLLFTSDGGRYSLRPVLPLTGAGAIDTTALTPVKTFTESDIIPGSFSKEFVENNERRDKIVNVVFNQAKTDEIGTETSVTVRYSSASVDSPVIQYDMTDFCGILGHATTYAKYVLALRKHSTHSVSFSVPLLTTSLKPMDVIKIQRQRENSVGDNRTETETYQVTSIVHGSDGLTDINAQQFPVDGSGVSKISDDVLNGSFAIS